MSLEGVARSRHKSIRKVAAGLSALSIAYFLLAGTPVQADTMIWSNGNDAGAFTGPII